MFATPPQMPAEWEEHDAIWLALPHDQEEWGDYFESARASVLELACELCKSGGERVELLVPAGEEAIDLPSGAVAHPARYGDIWLRDTGPIFVRTGDELSAAGFAFNGWGQKYLFEGDPEVADQIAALAEVRLQRFSWVLEGGAIDVDGVGTVLTTRQCVLNGNRNPDLDEAQLAARLGEAIGARQVIWIEEGLRGDHTDGHVDNIARFVAPGRVVHMMPSEASDPNAAILTDIQRQLRGARDADGAALELIALPSPGRVEGPFGPMPASYCNFLIANESVIVPTFGVSQDERALAIFADLFPGRRIVALHSFALLTGGGTVHCISQQQPRAPRPS